MSTSWYLSDPVGRRFNWNKAPTFQCPNAGAVTYTAAEDVGEASQSVEIPFAETPFDVGFNPDFLRDCLELADEDLVLRLISPLRPGMLESANGGGYRYLIMPIRLDV